ncbi:MAG: DUF4190 domain-containing protein, partial [Planctomycetes bacterium]|nr:DUF4190 domain-containing protein [Planctomycetota bacterium]
PKPAGGSGRGTGGSGRGRPNGRPAPKRRRYEDDDDYDHDRRADDYDDEDYAPPRPRRAGGEGDGAAVAALVLGVLALFPGCCCGVLAAPVGISAVVTGIIGLKSYNNKGMAVTGLVLGALSLCLSGVMLVAGVGNAILDPNRFK